MPVVTHLGKNIRVNLWFFAISLLWTGYRYRVLLRHHSYLNWVQVDVVSLCPFEPTARISIFIKSDLLCIVVAHIGLLTSVL